jgi:hypothetical protein
VVAVTEAEHGDIVHGYIVVRAVGSMPPSGEQLRILRGIGVDGTTPAELGADADSRTLATLVEVGYVWRDAEQDEWHLTPAGAASLD